MDILEKVKKYYKDFAGEKFILGRSYQNRSVFCFKVKKSDSPKVIVQYSIHAREYITAYLCLKQIDKFIKDGKVGTVYFIPILNPDGVNICLSDKPLYKANARGVDLNVNFDAKWGTGEKNVFSKSDESFVGSRPFSEKETRLLRDFTLNIQPDITISYHAKGEEIYYDFNQPPLSRKRDKSLALAVSKVTGYKIVENLNSAGGYKDWCIDKLKIPALTIEVGSDSLTHPIQEKHLEEIFEKNKTVINTVTEWYDG